MCALPTSTSTDIHCSKLYADDNRAEIKRPLAFPDAIDSMESKVGYTLWYSRKTRKVNYSRTPRSLTFANLC